MGITTSMFKSPDEGLLEKVEEEHEEKWEDWLSKIGVFVVATVYVAIMIAFSVAFSALHTFVFDPIADTNLGIIFYNTVIRSDVAMWVFVALFFGLGITLTVVLLLIPLIKKDQGSLRIFFVVIAYLLMLAQTILLAAAQIIFVNIGNTTYANWITNGVGAVVYLLTWAVILGIYFLWKTTIRKYETKVKKALLYVIFSLILVTILSLFLGLAGLLQNNSLSLSILAYIGGFLLYILWCYRIFELILHHKREDGWLRFIRRSFFLGIGFSLSLYAVNTATAIAYGFNFTTKVLPITLITGSKNKVNSVELDSVDDDEDESETSHQQFI